jgi:hypothetical protein
MVKNWETTAQQGTDAELLYLKAQALVKGYCAGLENTDDEDDFDAMVKQTEADFPEHFVKGKEQRFWQAHGGELLRMFREEVAELKKIKEVEFGRNSLNGLLASMQNAVAYNPPKKAVALLEKGVKAIAETPFLEKKERGEYRAGFLQTGILTMALSHPDEAVKEAERYFGAESEALVQRIRQAEALQHQENEAQKQAEERQSRLEKLVQAVAAWQEKEKGGLPLAVFYVLNENFGRVLTEENTVAYPLVEVCQVAQKLHKGESLTAEELEKTENLLIRAYRQKKLFRHEVFALQNLFLTAVTQSQEAEKLYDDKVERLADKALMEDVVLTEKSSSEQWCFMEGKAKIVLLAELLYYTLKADVQNAEEALAQVKKVLGLVPAKGGTLTFAEAAYLLKKHYSGSNTAALWHDFYKQLPTAEDKRALMQQIAERAEMLEKSQNFAE